MKVFISEYVCSGAWPHETIETSLACEGQSMLLAFLRDLTRLSGCQAVTTWDRRLGSFPLSHVRAIEISSRHEEQSMFQELSAVSDATLVIAPEFDNILLDRRHLIEKVHGRFLGSSHDAIRLCSNKMAVAEYLQHNDLATIATLAFDPHSKSPSFEFPIVLKPRDGAGSLMNFLVNSRDQFESARFEILATAPAMPAIQQPYIAGLSASVGTLIHGNEQIDVFPAGEQVLSDDGRLHYLGGVIPGRFDATIQAKLGTTVRRACECIPGLSGYVGFDLILPKENPACPVIVDINPRLTTSYLGYRLLTNDNIAERILLPGRYPAGIDWKDHRVVFSPDGSTTPR